MRRRKKGTTPPSRGGAPRWVGKRPHNLVKGNERKKKKKAGGRNGGDGIRLTKKTLRVPPFSKEEGPIGDSDKAVCGGEKKGRDVKKKKKDGKFDKVHEEKERAQLSKKAEGVWKEKKNILHSTFVRKKKCQT